MTVSKPASRPILGSNLKKLDLHVIQASEYEELPELTDDMLGRIRLFKGGRPRSANPKQLISLRMPPEIIERWRATGPGWQTRLVAGLCKLQPPSTGN